MARNVDRATQKLSAPAFPLFICLALLWLSIPNLEAQPNPANLAKGAAVDASGSTWGSLVPAALTDGDPATFAHPLAGSGTLGYYFEIDLGWALS